MKIKIFPIGKFEDMDMVPLAKEAESEADSSGSARSPLTAFEKVAEDFVKAFEEAINTFTGGMKPMDAASAEAALSEAALADSDDANAADSA